MSVVSLFCGIGGLDLGFRQEGFNIIWANDNCPSIWSTYQHNHPNTYLDKRSLVSINSTEIPDCDLIIGGPPCQSWSVAGSNKGANDPRGKLFYEYQRVIADKKPKVFVAENVEGILSKKHQAEFQRIIAGFENIGYQVHCQLLNASDYMVPQDRMRVIIVGIRKGTGGNFEFPAKSRTKVTLGQAIGDLTSLPIKAYKRSDRMVSDVDSYLDDSYSPQYMSRNRVRSFDELSYTIPATGRQVPIHPQAPKMIKVHTDLYRFCDDKGPEVYPRNGDTLYRRFTIHECARIQTFPDSFTLLFNNIDDGYKMLGNAVPVELARRIAECISPLITAPSVVPAVPVPVPAVPVPVKITLKKKI
jgi:DNA (cytosine-5)-methyltransferase 1